MDKTIRSRYFACILYPDNSYHCEYLQYLLYSQTGFYIIHDRGSDLSEIPYKGMVSERHIDHSKPHIHCIMIFKNARTEKGLINSLPKVRYYENVVTKQLYSLYDIPYISLPVQEVVRPLVEKFEPIIDIYAYCQYILHKDYKSIALGKRQYEINDIQMLNSERTLLDKFYTEREITDKDCIEIIQNIRNVADSYDTFVNLLAMYPDDKVLKYAQSHAYFIDKFIFNRKEVNK